MNIKKIIAGTIAGTIAFGYMALPVLADPGQDPNPNGYDSGYAAPGYNSARDNTVCADHGAFAYYSHGVMIGYDVPRAADGDHTAFNNSTLCGNPQGAAGIYP